MSDFLQTPAAQGVILLSVIFALIAVGVYFVSRFRDRIKDDGAGSNFMMTNFREMHSQGDLSDAEYRTIKTVLSGGLQDELKDTSEKG